MNSYLTTSQERDQFLAWLDEQRDKCKHSLETCRPDVAFYWQGRLDAIREVIANVKTGGKL